MEPRQSKPIRNQIFHDAFQGYSQRHQRTPKFENPHQAVKRMIDDDWNYRPEGYVAVKSRKETEQELSHLSFGLTQRDRQRPSFMKEFNKHLKKERVDRIEMERDFFKDR